jgi:membrane-associated phospholipid phosphatase
MIPNILDDQKQMWTLPVRVAKGQNLKPVLGVLAVTGALIASDPYSASSFRQSTSYRSFNHVFSNANSAAAIVAAPVGLWLYGKIRSDSETVNTAWLTGEALADSELLGLIMRVTDRRAKPSSFANRKANLSDNWLDSNVIDGSFPSGHAGGAFAVATVISRTYGKRHRWTPFVAYGLASAISFSRLTTGEHYPADVFLAAALGYSIGRFTVLRQ